jgi:hypothetical protein
MPNAPFSAVPNSIRFDTAFTTETNTLKFAFQAEEDISKLPMH